MTKKQPKPNYTLGNTNINNIKSIQKALSTEDQEDCTTAYNRYLAIEVQTTNSMSQNRSI